MESVDQSGIERAAFDSYLANLASLASLVAALAHETGTYGYARLIRLRTRLAFDSQPDTLWEVDSAVKQLFREMGSEVSKHRRDLAAGLAGLSSLASEACAALSARNERRLRLLRDLIDQLEVSAAIDPPEVASAFSCQQSAGLKRLMGQAAGEAQAHLAPLARHAGKIRQEIRMASQHRSPAALPDRYDTEQRMEALRAAGSAFSLLVFIWLGYAELRERVSRRAADQVLMEIFRRMEASVRPWDVVYRWSPNQFALLVEGSTPPSGARREQIAARLCGTYQVQIGEESEEVEVRVEVSAVQPPSE